MVTWLDMINQDSGLRRNKQEVPSSSQILWDPQQQNLIIHKVADGVHNVLRWRNLYNLVKRHKVQENAALSIGKVI